MPVCQPFILISVPNFLLPWTRTGAVVAIVPAIERVSQSTIVIGIGCKVLNDHELVQLHGLNINNKAGMVVAVVAASRREEEEKGRNAV